MLRENILNKIDISKTTFVKPSAINPLTAEELTDKLRNFPAIKAKTLFVINDQFRSTPSYKIIRVLRELGKINCSVSFIIATGTHQPPDKATAVKLCNAQANDTIYFHNVKALPSPAFGGITSRGTEVYYNPILNKYENIITIGSVEPHYFAGFTGGAKSLMPGVTAHSTILQNHRWAMDNSSELMKTNGNPVFEDIWESANLVHSLNKVLTIQIVNHNDNIFHLSHGEIKNAFNEARKASEHIYGKSFNTKFDIIITFAQSPLDKNLYQSQKCLENTRNVLKDGGSLILVSSCNEDTGSSAFYKTIKSLGTIDKIIKNLSFDKYKLGDHKAFRLANLAQNNQLLYVGELSEKNTAACFMQKISEDELIKFCNNWIRAEKSILIDDSGGFTAYNYII